MRLFIMLFVILFCARIYSIQIKSMNALNDNINCKTKAELTKEESSSIAIVPNSDLKQSKIQAIEDTMSSNNIHPGAEAQKIVNAEQEQYPVTESKQAENFSESLTTSSFGDVLLQKNEKIDIMFYVGKSFLKSNKFF